MAVRLRQQGEGVLRVGSQARVVVGQARHLLLLDDGDLALCHAEVSVLREQLASLGVGVAGPERCFWFFSWILFRMFFGLFSVFLGLCLVLYSERLIRKDHAA